MQADGMPRQTAAEGISSVVVLGILLAVTLMAADVIHHRVTLAFASIRFAGGLTPLGASLRQPLVRSNCSCTLRPASIQTTPQRSAPGRGAAGDQPVLRCKYLYALAPELTCEGHVRICFLSMAGNIRVTSFRERDPMGIANRNWSVRGAGSAYWTSCVWGGVR